MKDNAIRVENLVVEHRTVDETVRALDCRELSIEAGSAMAVTGPSGCGKSTLLGILAGLALPTTGSVTIGRTDITALPESSRVAFRRSTIGVVYQADNLLPFLTVAENVLLQLRLASDGPVPDAADRVERLLDRLGLWTLRGRLPDELSGGQRQRAAVARAVVHRPRVILADEPTGSLDESNAQAVVTVLLELQSDLGATLVLVTHDPLVGGQMQRILRLHHGAIVDESEVVGAH